jgi:hypothetical protein
MAFSNGLLDVLPLEDLAGFVLPAEEVPDGAPVEDVALLFERFDATSARPDFQVKKSSTPLSRSNSGDGPS